MRCTVMTQISARDKAHAEAVESERRVTSCMLGISVRCRAECGVSS